MNLKALPTRRLGFGPGRSHAVRFRNLKNVKKIKQTTTIPKINIIPKKKNSTFTDETEWKWFSLHKHEMHTVWQIKIYYLGLITRSLRWSPKRDISKKQVDYAIEGRIGSKLESTRGGNQWVNSEWGRESVTCLWANDSSCIPRYR